MRGFDIRGIGPRVLRYYLADSDGNGVYTREDSKADTDDALGGRIYYMARAELEIPLGSGAKEMGLRPSVFVDRSEERGVGKECVGRGRYWGWRLNKKKKN